MSSSTHDHNHPDLTPQLEKVSDGIFAYIQPDGSWWINNTGFLVAEAGVISIDACSTERRTRAYLKAISDVTDQPVRTLVNTHHHPDHTYGNWLFAGATIVAHERVRDEIQAFGPPASVPAVWEEMDFGHIELAPPFLTYVDGVTLWSDDRRCEVRYVGTPAHTTNDSVIWVPDRSVLFAGDLLFKGGTPFLLMGSISGTLRVLDDLEQLGADTIVPGHGPICGPEVINEVRGYVRFVQQIAADGRAAGLNPLEAGRQVDLGPYADLLDRERIVGNLYRAYAEIDGAAPGAPIDIGAALHDMVEYNGGQPLRCYA